MKIRYSMLILLILLSCDSPSVENHDEFLAASTNFSIPDKQISDDFKDYWYNGTAEISRYELSQNRYGDVHPGSVIMIFVTEDFLTDKQVKNDRYINKNSVSIMKNNMLKKFPTGIYDYSMMNSVFSPVNLGENANSLKVTSSTQEWCGQTYSQLNLKGKQYQLEIHSYFETEGDLQMKIKKAFLEDEIYNRIRIKPSSLPEGDIEMIPSLQVARLMHFELAPVKAMATVSEYVGGTFQGDQLQSYTVEFPSLNRKLEVIFESAFPYRIIGWQDTYPSAFDKMDRTTIARKTHERISSYWRENGLEDMTLRGSLGL